MGIYARKSFKAIRITSKSLKNKTSFKARSRNINSSTCYRTGVEKVIGEVKSRDVLLGSSLMRDRLRLCELVRLHQ